MASIYDNIFNRGAGIYGYPVPSSLNDKKLPENPRIVLPDVVKRSGGLIEGWDSDNENEDILPSS